jgi:multiple sugar transport system ATP-binding protein
MSAFRNMAFGLKLRKVPRPVIRERVGSAAGVLGLKEVLDKRPRTLSGGQRQRVAMGRAIVREPQAFLMDEPLSNLDAKLRVEMRAEIARLQRDLDVTTIYVTHDQTEAMTLGDRVAVLRDGFLQQLATPQELYDVPVNLFVAEFIGSPAMNLVGADLVSVTGGNGHRIAAVVDIREDMGSEVFLHFGVGGRPVLGKDVQAAVGEDAVEATQTKQQAEGGLWVARVDRESAAREGDRVELTVHPRRLHFFAPETGAAIYD